MHYIKAECDELLLKCIQCQEKKESIEFEYMGDGLVLLTLRLDSQNAVSCPNYYRILGNGTNPPLEIGINTSDYSIQKITAFLDFETLKQVENYCTHYEKGTVIVKGEVFKNDGLNFIDKEGEYSWQVNEGKLICIFGEVCNEIKEIMNHEIGFLFNKNNTLIGFCIENINGQKLRILNKLLK